jgi:hypothetical protein
MLWTNAVPRVRNLSGHQLQRKTTDHLKCFVTGNLNKATNNAVKEQHLPFFQDTDF